MLFMGKMLDVLARKGWYFFYGYSGYNHISIAHKDNENYTFTSPYGTFAFVVCHLHYVMHQQHSKGS